MGDCDINSSSIKERIFFVETAEREGMVGPLSPEEMQYLQKKYCMHLEIEKKTGQIGQNRYLLIQVNISGSTQQYVNGTQKFIDILVNERDALVKAAEAARFC